MAKLLLTQQKLGLVDALQLLARVLFPGTYGYWQQMKTTEDLEGLEFS